MVPVNAYIGKMKFAGTRIEVISREGDVLIPRITVYYDGAIPESEIYDRIEEKLNGYIMGMPFDSSVYVSSVIEAVRSTEHVTDVYIDERATPEQGIFIASYDADGNLLPRKSASHHQNIVRLHETVVRHRQGTGTANIPAGNQANR